MTTSYLISRDDEWQPSTPEEQLDRLISAHQIWQLALRYALAVDSRNMDDLAELFIPDVQLGKSLSGRDQLKQWMTKALANHGRTIHLVANHVVCFLDADHASGVVYCRDEVERDERWKVGHIQYWDTYERREGRWYFQRRRYNRWGIVDELVRTKTGFEDSGLPTSELPQAWPSWDRFHRRLSEESPVAAPAANRSDDTREGSEAPQSTSLDVEGAANSADDTREGSP